MLAGPIFSREALTAPRQFRHYLMRSGYVAALFVLMYTIRQATIGFQDVRNIGDIARFGSLVFQVFGFLQLTLVLFFALLFAAGNVAQEKDRRTLILLLMTDLRDRELVLGKLGAGLLPVGTLLAVSIPVFCLLHLLGGVGLDQIIWCELLCLATALAAGSWGSFVAFWREKTFQTLAISVLGIVVFLGLVQAVAAWAPESVSPFVMLLNPFAAMSALMSPLSDPARMGAGTVSALGTVLSMLGVAVSLNLATTWKLRVWNPTRVNLVRSREEDAQGQVRARNRTIWDRPIIWREMKTRAYGRRVVLIKAAYVLLVLCIAWLLPAAQASVEPGDKLTPVAMAFVGLSLLSILLLNAQSVTALTTEKDMKTLELLLVTDVTAKEFIFGKLGGILYNTRELILAPLLILGYAWGLGLMPGFTLEYFIYLTIGFIALTLFAAMLGLHSGLSHDSSRAAIANSLGTVFFLFVGIMIFMILLVEARSSFAIQFQSFLVFIGFGSIGLYASLTHKNPSPALTIAAGVLPFLTFYAITEYLLGGSLGVCLWVTVAYGFATIAMLIPSVSDFDVALGRTTVDQG